MPTLDFAEMLKAVQALIESRKKRRGAPQVTARGFQSYVSSLQIIFES